MGKVNQIPGGLLYSMSLRRTNTSVRLGSCVPSNNYVLSARKVGQIKLTGHRELNIRGQVLPLIDGMDSKVPNISGTLDGLKDWL